MCEGRREGDKVEGAESKRDSLVGNWRVFSWPLVVSIVNHSSTTTRLPLLSPTPCKCEEEKQWEGTHHYDKGGKNIKQG